MTLLRCSLVALLLLFACPSHAFEVPKYTLPQHESWVKGPSGKHKMQHVYDFGTYKKGRNVSVDSYYPEATVGMAVSKYGEYATVEIKYAPYSYCAWTSGRDDCFVTVTKGKTSKRFSFQDHRTSSLIIDDIQGFIDFIDGPEPFTITYRAVKGKRAVIKFK